MSLISQILSKIAALLAEPVPLVEGRWLNITFDVPILVDIEAPLSPVLIFIYCLECILIMFGMCMMVYFTRFINRNGVIHLNLQYLFVGFTGLYEVASLARFYMILVQFKVVKDFNTPFLLLAGLIRIEHYGLSLSAILVVTVERIFATYYVVDYEAKRRVWVAILSGTVGLTYTQFFVIPVCFFKAPLYYIILYASSWSIFATIILFGLQRFNVQESQRLSWKAENLRKLKNVNYTLGKKFQVEENVKVIRLLLALSTMLVFLIILVIIFIVVPRVYIGTGTYAGQVMISLFDINVALGTLIIPSFSIWRIRKTRNLSYTGKIHEERRVNPITVFEDATKTYFDQFHTSWQ